ncbi:MAG: tetratricopeptide repeat protein [Lacrimispora sp.]
MSHDRLFRNMEMLRYRNRIHEYLDESGMAERVFDAKDMLTIFHTGYTSTAFQGKNKMDRNISILKQVVSDNPGDYDARIYLGNSYFGNNQYESAEEVYYQVMEHIESVDGEELKELFFCNFLKLKYGKVMEPGEWKVIDREEDIIDIYNRSIDCACASPDAEFWVGNWMFAKEKNRKELLILNWH